LIPHVNYINSANIKVSAQHTCMYQFYFKSFPSLWICCWTIHSWYFKLLINWKNIFVAICTCCIYYTSSPKLSISNCTENILMVPHLIQRCTEENWFVLIFCMYMHKDMTEWWISQCGHCDLNLGWQLHICYFLYHECCLCPIGLSILY
jgi:hypothetical protein